MQKNCKVAPVSLFLHLKLVEKGAESRGALEQDNNSREKKVLSCSVLVFTVIILNFFSLLVWWFAFC